MGQLTARSLTIPYVVALGLVGLCTLVSHFSLTRVLHEREGSAKVINISGRQRMLSQRIAGLAAQRALGVDDPGGDLDAAIDRFEADFRALRFGDAERGIPAGDAPALRAIYVDRGLADEAAAYVDDARRVAAMDLGDPAMADELAALFERSRESLLRKLDDIVTVHQAASERNLAVLELLQEASLGVVFVTLIFEALAVFRPMVNRVVAYAGDLLRMATTDELTQVLNRRAFFKVLGEEVERAQRHGRPLGLLLLDIDHFKRVNDAQGHAGGDAVLRCLPPLIRRSLRDTDAQGRLGGEEFAILMPETDLDGALVLAERIREAVEGMAVPYQGRTIRVTASIGAAAFGPGADDPDALLNQADRALYRAKAAGRDRVVAASTLPKHATLQQIGA